MKCGSEKIKKINTKRRSKCSSLGTLITITFEAVESEKVQDMKYNKVKGKE